MEGPVKRAIVLLHAGVADRRMWEPLLPELPAGRRVLRPDMRGFGESPLEPGSLSHARDVAALLDDEGLDRVAVVGASYGGRVALQVASNWPDRVSGLALLGSATIGHDWSAGFREYDEAEEAALEAGDVDAAVDLNVRTWVDAGRDPSEVDPEIRSLVGEMQRRIYELQEGVEAEEESLPIQPELITAPTILAVGELDLPDFHAIARDLAAAIPNATGPEVVAGAAHLVALERPEETARLIGPVL
jgi:3-oxoadipate enol-lactonase